MLRCKLLIIPHRSSHQKNSYKIFIIRQTIIRIRRIILKEIKIKRWKDLIWKMPNFRIQETQSELKAIIRQWELLINMIILKRLVGRFHKCSSSNIPLIIYRNRNYSMKIKIWWIRPNIWCLCKINGYVDLLKRVRNHRNLINRKINNQRMTNMLHGISNSECLVIHLMEPIL